MDGGIVKIIEIFLTLLQQIATGLKTNKSALRFLLSQIGHLNPAAI